ncbi:hydrolase [Desulfosarcina widdelii]|uniref:Hydrolase n=1 Tax=Desulfosarcina widdelii TaxID=947919 RepID=A0A5K7Z1I0_9BACT|nr:metal-dependent hydrolase [Desulfosarcina widdelii]BBO75536.1 hydrolase [Desulfosarcina widdelii]
MDSLTQLTFGAACGEAILGKKVGRKALVWGAVLGTLPDLDVFIPLGGPVDNFVYHRGFSHSLILLVLLSPMIAWLISNIHSDTKRYYRRWVLLAFLVLETSVLLDLLTIYGTQIFWPFDTTPMALPILFIIDPLFTLPILSGVLAALVLKRNRSLGHRLNSVGLFLSLIYLAWAFGAGEFVERRVKEKLAHQQVSHSQLISSPAPFTTLLWRVVGIDKDRYFETYFSLFDKETPLLVDFHPRNLALMTGIEEHPPVVKLKWFTRGYYAFSTVDEDVVMTDLRMGSEPDYVFRFKVARLNDLQPYPIDDERLKTSQDWRRLAWVWKRIWNARPEG